jgi:hypothetical protein
MRKTRPPERGRKIVAIVEELGDMVTTLPDAEPEHKLGVDRNLGLRLTYDREPQAVRADTDLAPHLWKWSVSERHGHRNPTPDFWTNPRRSLVNSV